MAKAEREILRRRIKNLYNMVSKLIDEGKIMPAKFKTKKSAFINSSGEFK